MTTASRKLFSSARRPRVECFNIEKTSSKRLLLPIENRRSFFHLCIPLAAARTLTLWGREKQGIKFLDGVLNGMGLLEGLIGNS